MNCFCSSEMSKNNFKFDHEKAPPSGSFETNVRTVLKVRL